MDTLKQEHDESVFLHDLANPLAAAYGHLRLLEGKLTIGETALDHQALVQRITKILESMERVNQLLRDRRTYLESRQ